MVLQSFDGTTVPRNGSGDGYPNNYVSSTEGGPATYSIDSSTAVSGNSLKMSVTSGALYAQFNPYTGSGRIFARDYSANPAGWQFNTYNRLSFWIKRPTSATALRTDGQTNMNVGTYVKRVSNPDSGSDEAGGGHFYHNLNLPNTGTWTLVTLNMHPDHERGASGGTEHPIQTHPTGEAQYNYFDALTRFYIQDNSNPSAHPANYWLDEVGFAQVPHAEADDQVRNIAATYVAGSNRVILTWFRNKNENEVKHEVRYAFSDIHQLGWGNATAAPNGVVTPPGWQGYNGMVYDTTALPLAGRSVVYLAIKPQNSSLFTQVVLPLNLG
jgi:hypothetical protein